MTSQIALFNQRGVAVASDTVVTITSGEGVRTRNNIDKIWTLGGSHLVVVLVSGRPEINLVDGRILVTEWSRTLDTPLPTVSDYASSFANWLSSDAAPIHESGERSLVHECLREHLRYIYQGLSDDIEELDLTEHQIPEYFRARVNARIEALEQRELYAGASDESDSSLLDSHQIDSVTMVDRLFEDCPGLEEVRPRLLESLPLALSRRDHSRTTTLAFVGFGADDMFPKSVQLECRGRYGGIARVTIAEPFGPSHENLGGALSMYAQDSAIQGFLRGVQLDALEAIIDGFSDYVIEKSEDKDEGIQRANEMADTVREKIFERLNTAYVYPMLDTIGSLGLSDLVELARSLVGIQAMRANASPTPPGVGGLIESLVIDRSRGIRWTSRLS